MMAAVGATLFSNSFSVSMYFRELWAYYTVGVPKMYSPSERVTRERSRMAAWEVEVPGG